MWRRLSHHLRTLGLTRSNPKPVRFVVASSTVPTNIRRSAVVISRHFSTAPGTTITVDDVMPIATGHEREELQAALAGKNVLEINYPSGPFGTKEEPAVVKSYYDKRIVGCPGVEGEDEHDIVWFWLEKGKPHECPVCSQYFVKFIELGTFTTFERNEKERKGGEEWARKDREGNSKGREKKTRRGKAERIEN